MHPFFEFAASVRMAAKRAQKANLHEQAAQLPPWQSCLQSIYIAFSDPISPDSAGYWSRRYADDAESDDEDLEDEDAATDEDL